MFDPGYRERTICAPHSTELTLAPMGSMRAMVQRGVCALCSLRVGWPSERSQQATV